MRKSLNSFTAFIILLILVAVHLQADMAAAGENFTPVYKPALHIQKAGGEIKIDGRLDDRGWKGAAPANNFVENSPGDQVKPPVETKALLAYDDGNLYVAVICYDNPEDIRASLCERDRLYSEDNVGFFFDTYGDAAWAYTLNVNPYGIQADAIWTNGFGEDSKFDLIWESAGRITDSGYQVEMAIPFSSLRFPDREKQTWKVEFWRHHYRDSHHQISWCAYDRSEPCWPCQWGTVTGIEYIRPGKGIEILPSAIGYQSGSLLGNGTDTLPYSFDNEDADGEFSVGAKYSITSNIAAEITFNPDFSQVEADADQVDVNTTTALTFPEKRPFFQEGGDLFRTPFEVVHTRSINNPGLAAKLTARMGRTSIAYLGAWDENSPIIIPFEESSSDVLSAGNSLSNMLRIRQTFGENSQAGLLMTDRQFEEGGAGSLYGLDGSFRLSKNLRFRCQTIASYTDEPDDTSITADYNDFLFDDKHTAGFDGENFWGHAYIGLLDYEGRDIFISGRYSELSSAFRNDIGNERLNNRRQASIISEYRIRMDKGIIDWIMPNIFAARIWNTDGKIKDGWIFLSLSTQLKKYQAGMHAEYLISAENYSGIQFDDIWNWHNCYSFFPSNVIAFGGAYSFGHRIARRAKVMGKEKSVSGWLDLRPLNGLYIENWFNYASSRNIDTDEELFDGYIARSRLNMQFTRELSLRFVAQYNDFYKTWDFDPLITYRISPFSLFYIGTTYDYEKIYGLNEDGDIIVPDGENGRNITRLRSRQFFMKLQYLFQI
jgi:hypothetical protein